jgi:hypothetical protein
LNFRIDLPRAEVEKKIQEKQWDYLYEYDQVKLTHAQILFLFSLLIIFDFPLFSSNKQCYKSEFSKTSMKENWTFLQHINTM